LLDGSGQFACPWNFGPYEDDAWPVQQIVDAMVLRWGDGASWVRDLAPSVHEANSLKLDASKARTQLNWTPRLRLHIALEWVVDWYRAWNAGADMHAFTRSQIAQYESLPPLHEN
jgi:CDP-glucose 4,6-dehydratase